VDTQPIEDSPFGESFKRLCERAEATLDFSTGDPFFEEFVQCFIDHCDEEGLWNPRCRLIEKPPDDFGQEHSVWFNPSDACYYKLTHSGFYGLNVVYRDECDRYATPFQYLERWLLHNQMFGDSVEWLGCFREKEESISLLIRQPAVEGVPASDVEIHDFFKEVGWVPFRIGGEHAFYAQENGIVISDTHRGNLVKTHGGLLVPIDLRLQRIRGSLQQAVLNQL